MFDESLVKSIKGFCDHLKKCIAAAGSIFEK